MCMVEWVNWMIVFGVGVVVFGIVVVGGFGLDLLCMGFGVVGLGELVGFGVGLSWGAVYCDLSSTLILPVSEFSSGE